MNKSMFTRTTHQKSVSSIREHNVNKTSEHCPSVSPRNERQKAIILDKSISPNWDRLSKPRYVSPLISINRSLNEHRTENVLPSIKNTESEIEKQIKTKRQKVKDLLLDPKLIIYQKSLVAPCLYSPSSFSHKKAMHRFNKGTSGIRTSNKTKFEARLMSQDVGKVYKVPLHNKHKL